MKHISCIKKEALTFFVIPVDVI